MFQKIFDKVKALKDKADLSHAKQLALDGLELAKSEADTLSQAIETSKQLALDNLELAKSEAAELSLAIENTKQLALDSLELAKSEAANLSQTLEVTKKLALDGLEVANDFLEQNWPKIENILINELLTATEDKLKDDKTLAALLDETYEFLPLPVRLVLPHEKFIEFSMKNREALLKKLQEHKKKLAIGEASAPETFDSQSLS